MKILTNVPDVRDAIAELTFGISRTDALRKEICIDCKKPIAELLGDRPTEQDRAEYEQSALCPRCFTAIEKSEMNDGSLM